MNLAEMTNENLIILDLDCKSKEEVINKMIKTLYKENIISSEEEFLKTVLERESHSPTGLEGGLAIPHGKSSTVKKGAFAVARLKTPLEDWESIDENNKVSLVFLLAIPIEEAGSTHLKLLAELSTMLMDENFVKDLKNVKTRKQLLNILNNDKTEKKQEITEYKATVLAVTACAAGIAHTYMAAEALEKAGRELGIRVLVEKQGANGIEDAHTKNIINEADAIVLATDIAPKNVERFNGKKYVKTKVAEPLKSAKEILERALNNPDGVVSVDSDGSSGNEEKKEGILGVISQAVMTGISYMIPVIVAAGLMLGIAKLGAMGFGIVKEISNPEYATNSNNLIVFLHFLDAFGSMIFKFLYPIFSAYVAYSIADRTGLVSGFLGGAFAAGLHFTFWGVQGGIPSGFFGAVVLGLAAGFICKFLNEKVKLPRDLAAMKPMFIIPAVSVLSIFVLNFYLVDPVFGALNKWLQDLIMNAQGAGTLTLSAIIAAATAFDLGGPVNKAAGAIAIGLAADNIFPLTPRVLAIVIPPIGLGLATVIDKFLVKERVFDENLRITGKTSLVLGFIAISEGALPFMLKNPLITIPINIIGAVLGAVVAVALNAVQWYPLPAIWGWPLVENLWAYLLGLAVGVVFIAVANVFVRYAIIKKKRKIEAV